MRPAAPAHLTEPQRAAWDEALDVLEAAGRAERVNLTQLEVYARAMVRMREAEKHVADYGVIVAAPRTGLPMRNPRLAIATEASAVVAKLSRELGIEGGGDQVAAAPAAGEPMHLNAYAKRRGVTHVAVKKAIDTGRLKECLVEVGGKWKIADPELADREWEANTRPRVDHAGSGAAPADGGGEATPEGALDYAEVRRRREVELLRQAQVKSESDALDLARRRGELVPLEDVRADVFEAYSIVRTRLLGVPARAKQRLPHLGAGDVATLDELIREALEELAGRAAV